MTDARVTRIHQLSDELADLFKQVGEGIVDLLDLGVEPGDLVPMIADRIRELHPNLQATVARIAREVNLPGLSGAGFGVVDGKDPDELMRKRIDSLFAEAGVKIGDDDAPAIKDSAIWLRGAAAPITGVLTRTPDGLLKLGTVDADGKGGSRLVEAFFAYEDVLTIAVTREMKVTASSLFTSH